MGSMKDLLGDAPYTAPDPPKAHARRSDPSTSHEAAAKHTAASLTEKQQIVLAAFRERRQMTDADLQDHLRSIGIIKDGKNGSTYRTRRGELVDLGRVRNSGRRKHQEGSNRIIWEIVP